MHITRLKLLGFKSFVEPAELIIRPGLTGVVGPNGCGKSNLLEALRWVMGETSYKAMRGGAMDDVIFSGTQHRPARNSAEVTIEIDNKDRTAPAEFNDNDTLEIVRVIERSQGSRYLINGKETRAKDIKLLFEDAATGARSHALVRQGQIGEIVNAKPQARRRILEDAAGIAGLHTRRHEAELRLKATEDNLDRLSDVMGQMEAQLNSLKRQARHALKYKEINQKLRQLEALVFHLKWRAAGDAITKAELNLNESLEKVGRFTADEAKLLSQSAQASQAIKPLRDIEAQKAALLQRLNVALDALSKEEEQTIERREELATSLTAAEHDLVREEHLIVEAKEIINNLQTEASGLVDVSSKLETQRQDALAEHNLSCDLLREGEDKLNALASHYSDSKANHQSLNMQISSLGERIGRSEERQAKLLEEQSQLQANFATKGNSAQLKKKIATLQQSLEGLKASLRKQEDALDEKRHLEAELVTEISQCALRSGTLATEIALLEKLLTSNTSKDHEPVLDKINTKPGYEIALWAALGEDLDGSLEHDAPIYWRDDFVGEAPPLPDGARCLAHYVEVPDALKLRLSQIGVVDDDDALNLQPFLKSGQRLVSKQGGLWRWDGFTTRSEAPSSAPQKLTERNRLPALERELATVNAAHDAVLARQERVVSERLELENKYNQERLAFAQTQDTLNASEQELRALLNETQTLSNQLAANEQSLSELANGFEVDKAAFNKAQTEITQLNDLAKLEADVEQNQTAVQTLRERQSSAQLALADVTREIELNNKRCSDIDVEQNRWLERSKLADEHIEELKERIEKNKDGLKAFENLPQQFAERRSKLLDEISIADKNRQQAADELVEAENICQQYDNQLKALQKEMMDVRETKARLETKLETARESLTTIASDIRSTFDCLPDQCLQLAGLTPDDVLPELGDALEDVSRLKGEREKLGGVNLRAEEEIRTLEDQFGSMIDDKDDLSTAINELRGAINSINEEGRQRLLAAFDEVNGHFKRLFQTLFAGGEAELQLVDSDDPLESGLEIVARPPGKKPQVLTLLSGGEKALTALSLIFAVFLTNPSPICVLDEVDAPLDDTNVERFCVMMEEMAKNTDTRFLVITHHPLTMERMDRLFGVTMGEKGVSQLVSVDLATAETFREAS